MQGSVRVRAAAGDDAGRIVEIAGRAPAASRWMPAEYEKYVSRPSEGLLRRCLLVAEGTEGVEGFAAGTFLVGDESATLENLAVVPEARRRGVARALIYGVEEWARTAGAAELKLEVRESNLAARRLYEARGFVEDGRRPKYYSGPDEDGLLMSLRLH